jgi:hypothetical protein
MKSIITHLKNKFPHARVIATGNSISVEKDGELLVHIVKNAHGYKCRKDLGAKYKFDLSPIPKEACAFKQCKTSKCIVAHDDFKARRKAGLELSSEFDYVPSIEELRKEAGQMNQGNYDWNAYKIERKAKTKQ